MDVESFKLIWNAALTIGGAVIAYFYNEITKKYEKVFDKAEKLQHEINTVKLQYVEKSEIQRIEQRIDARFLEMREFITQILDRNAK